MLKSVIAFWRIRKPIWIIDGHPYTTCGNEKPNWKVAVVLNGCGVFDGTEIHETAATLVHLTKKQMQPIFYSPCLLQTDVINHLTGERMKEARNMLIESARIARGEVKGLHELTTSNADAVVFPGGFGVAKNLSNFATAAASCALNLDVCRIIKEFHACKKPMGFMCISSILAARMIPNARITLGLKGDGYGQRPEDWPHSSAIDAATEMGACVEFQDVMGISIDKENMIVSTPAFMYKGQFHEIFAGIGKMIDHLECLLNVTDCENC